MNETYIIMDMSSVCYAGAFAYPDLTFDGKPTGVILHFFNTVAGFAKRYGTNKFILCWDSRKSYRKKSYPEYKANRGKDLDPSIRNTFRQAQEQMIILRKEMALRLGFRNSFMQVGLEADDLIAQVRGQIAGKLKVIVSTDHDLFQCMGCSTVIVPRISAKEINIHEFYWRYGIPPSQWSEVLAIAGCSSDNVKGIPGIGSKRAVQHIRGLLHGKYEDAIQANLDLLERNLELVRLPHARTKSCVLMGYQFYDDKAFNHEFHVWGLVSHLRKQQFWSMFCRGKISEG